MEDLTFPEPPHVFPPVMRADLVLIEAALALGALPIAVEDDGGFRIFMEVGARTVKLGEVWFDRSFQSRRSQHRTNHGRMRSNIKSMPYDGALNAATRNSAENTAIAFRTWLLNSLEIRDR